MEPPPIQYVVVPARQAFEGDIAAPVPSTQLANFGNVESARQGAMVPAFSAEYAQYISLQENVLVALSGMAADAEMRCRACSKLSSDKREAGSMTRPLRFV
jgi:hypothetical protein